MPRRIHLMPCSSPCPGAAFPSSVVFKKIINPHKCPFAAAQLMTPELFRAGQNSEKRSNSVSHRLLIPLWVDRFLLFSVISSCNDRRLSVFPQVMGFWKSRQPSQWIRELWNWNHPVQAVSQQSHKEFSMQNLQIFILKRSLNCMCFQKHSHKT